MRQSFLRLGDMIAASLSLAVVTAALPLAMLAGLVVRLRNGRPRGMAMAEVAAMVTVLQWTVVLAAWELLPLRLWR